MDIAFICFIVAGSSLLTFLVTSLHYETRISGLFSGISLVLDTWLQHGGDLGRMSQVQLWWVNRTLTSLAKDREVRYAEGKA